ncbi:hypothetical protein SAMN05444273_11610 [Litoreibacter ascidiaceicola]|uniref:Uncharacterized protein n=1 Tax=Litoreibacter ascidiaceicola TaxID=1486859 RepID=A0A1M5EXK6_9RHOB|nr:hypothetical protein SAMN05444273_11610 [Litoreibacter ascidiaceicola]
MERFLGMERTVVCGLFPPPDSVCSPLQETESKGSGWDVAAGDGRGGVNELAQ